MRGVALVGCVTLGTLQLVGCSQPLDPPNIVLVTIDTLRADRTSLHGYPVRTTPHLEQLAHQGVWFDKAYAPMPTTLPSHASMLTSKLPLVHGVVRNGMILDGEHVLLAEVLRGAGYRTAAVVSSFPLDHQFGLSRGFDHYDDNFDDTGGGFETPRRWEGHEVLGSFDRRATETTDRATRWLEEYASGSRFFLWVHYFDPHSPYDPPSPWRERHVSPDWSQGDLRRLHGAYDGEVAYTDHEVGRFVRALDALAPREHTVLVITADHGEGLRDHGFVGHGPILYEETLHVPLVFRWTGRIPGGRTLRGPVTHVDLMPTVLGLLGLDIAPGRTVLQGLDLSDALVSDAPLDVDRPLYFQRRRYESRIVHGATFEGVQVGESLSLAGSKYAVLHPPWKYIVAGEEGTVELYDLSRDPGEKMNVAARHQGKVRELSQALEGWLAEQASIGLGASREVTDDQLERLRTLGYVR